MSSLEKKIDDYLKQNTLDYILSSPVGEKLDKAMNIYEDAQNKVIAFINKDEKTDLTAMKTGTVLTLEVLKKYAANKSMKSFSKDDWIDIANGVVDYAIIGDGQKYSEFIFGLYNRYISFWTNTLKGVITDKTYDSLQRLSEEIKLKTVQFENGLLSEQAYVEDCMWICLEAMLKLLAASVSFIVPTAKKEDGSHVSWLEDLSEAVAVFSFEYGRYSLYAKEQELLNEYIEHQKMVDEELDAKFSAYADEIKSKSEEFYNLLDNAFADDFREVYLYSIRIAKMSGVKEEDILDSSQKIDEFFM